MSIYIFFSTSSLFQPRVRITMLLVATLFVLTACDDDATLAESSKKNVIHNVALHKIEQQMLPLILPVPGTVVTKNSLKIASRITGFIEQVNIDEGDIVKPGDVLVEIDNARVEADIKGADAAVLAAKADLLDVEGDVKRIKKLVRSKLVSKDSLRKTKVRLAQTKAALASAKAAAIAKRQERRYSHIISPAHAQVRERLRDPGDLTTVGEPILQLDVLGAMELHIYLPSTRISNVAIGQIVNVKIESHDELLESKVVNIVRSADEVTRRYKVRLLLPSDENLTPGQFGQAQFILRDEAVIAIPVSAIIERAGTKGVFITDASNTLHFRSIRLGKAWQDLREVLAGLEPGMLIVTNPSSTFHEGNMVKSGESH